MAGVRPGHFLCCLDEIHMGRVRPVLFFPRAAIQLRHRIGDCDCLYTHSGHAAQQVNNLLFVVGEAVSVEFFADGWIARLFSLC